MTVQKCRNNIQAMPSAADRISVLYSFDLKLGATRICDIAWHQVVGLAAAGADVIAFPASICKAVPESVRVRPTLACGCFRLPQKPFGRLPYAAFHDCIVARRLGSLKGSVDIIHTWPISSLRTLKTARKLGVPTVLERCNTRTRFAYTVVEEEYKRLGVVLPGKHEHAYNAKIL